MGVIELPVEVVTLIEGGVAGWLATADKEGSSETTRVTGAVADAKRRSVTLYVPIDQAGMTFENLRKNGRLATIFVRVTNYRAAQIKGDLIAMREGNEADRERITRYSREFVDDCAKLGLPRELMSNLRDWPAMAVEMSVTDVFAQSPGPEAGAPWR